MFAHGHSTPGEVSGRRTAGDRRVGTPGRTRAFDTESRPGGPRFRRAQASPVLIINQEDGDGTIPVTDRRQDERQNRRAPSTVAGAKRGDDERSRSELARFSPAAGDPIACRSAVTRRKGAPARHQPLCVFRVGGWI